MLKFACLQNVDGVLPPHEPYIEDVECFLVESLLGGASVVVEQVAEVGESNCLFLSLFVVQFRIVGVFYFELLMYLANSFLVFL